MDKKRLLKLATMLEADAKNKHGIKFNLYTVVDTDDPAKDIVPMNCGTSACAMGLAALSGAFKRGGGLSYKLKKDRWGEIIIATTIDGRARQYDRAAMSVFGLTMRQADFLFTPGSYPDHTSMKGADAERFVAARIRDFVAGKVAPD